MGIKNCKVWEKHLDSLRGLEDEFLKQEEAKSREKWNWPSGQNEYHRSDFTSRAHSEG